ncbi:MAG: AAA family ATPase [Chloroflexi bacterium]|nr:AAA family ATPase [Chloroflexota bacterium]
MTETPTAHRAELTPYLPRLVRLWSTEADAPRARVLDGSLVSVDISGFTALSEQLAAKGREGAEELVRTISEIFAELIEVAERHGGDVLKFRGDALLLLFLDDRHAARACGAASDMQWAIERIGAARSSAGEVELRMSAGVHSGPINVFLTERPHRELLVAGAAATRVFELEDLAGASEIVVSAETAAAVDPSWLLEERDGARLLRRLEPGSSEVPPPPDLPGERLEEYVPTSLRDHLAVASGEAEHRHVPVAFVKLVGTDALLEELGPEGFLARLEGKERAVIAHHVGRATGMRETIAADAFPIVGRDEELALLQGALDAARMRQFGLVELVGEPGMGKSRLVAEMRTQALGFAPLNLAGEQYASATPYGAWRTALRQLVGITPDRSREEAGAQLAPFVTGMMPDLAPWLPLLAIPFDAEVPSTPDADALDAGDSRERLQATVTTFLERMLMMPTLVVIEDAHWLDDASRSLVRELASSDMPRPWLVLVTSRPSGERIVAPDLPGQRIELAPLDTDAAEQLALAVAEEHAFSEDAMRALAERAGGNPLFLRELVAAARDGASGDLPESVETLLTTRIDTLAPADRMLLRYAAVIGPSFRLELVGEILADEMPGGEDPARWKALSEFVLPSGEDELAFRHDLVRQTAYGGLSFRRRRDIHGRVGLALERRAAGRAEEEAAILSLHFLEAGDGERAWRYAVAAADRAAAGFANVVAAELYERALGAHELRPADTTDRARVLEALGDVRERFGAYEPALEAYEQARAAHEEPLDRARLLARIAHCLDREGRYDDALEAFAEARALVSVTSETAEELETLATIEIGLASVAYRRAIYADAIGHATAAADLAERASRPAALAHALLVAGVAHTDLGRPEAVPLFEHSITISEQHGLHRLRGSALNNLGIHHYTEGRWDQAVACYRESREAKLRAGDPVGAAMRPPPDSPRSMQGGTSTRRTHAGRSASCSRAATRRRSTSRPCSSRPRARRRSAGSRRSSSAPSASPSTRRADRTRAARTCATAFASLASSTRSTRRR